MKDRVGSRERQVAWRLTQVAILAVTSLLVLSVADGWDEHGPEGRSGGPSTVAEPATDKAPDRVDPGQLESASPPEPTIAPDELRTFTLVATGELLVHEFVADTAALYGGDGFDFSPMFRRVRPILAGADLALCHLETPLSPDNSKFEFYPLFLVPFQLAAAIGGAGYDGCSVASNHLLDYGESGVVATLDHLAAAGVAASGAASDPTGVGPAWFSPGGVTVAHLSYTDTMNVASLPSDPPWLVNHLEGDGILADADDAVADGAEFVVVSLHFEKPEYQTGLSAEQSAIAEQLLASPDVDLVIGHGSHVVQPVVRRNGKYAVVGLGNFLSNQPGDERRRCTECPPATQDGLVAWFAVAERPDGSFTVVDAGYVPTWVDRRTFEIVPLGVDEPESIDPAVLAESATRTAAVVEPALRPLEFGD